MQTTMAGKVALVTGAAGGLGRQIARRLAEAGAHVVASDVADVDGTDLVRELGTASYVRLDVTAEADWERAFEYAAAGPGPVDILVNNAGYYQPNITLQDMDLLVWRKHFSINADGTFLGCRQALRSMPGRGGVILNIASDAALNALETGAAYCSSKAVVLMLTRVAAKAGGRSGIRANALLPGAVPTAMLRGNLQPGQTEEEFIEKLRGYHPLGRLATPMDIAEAAWFLCSDASGFISGASLPVDGGATA